MKSLILLCTMVALGSAKPAGIHREPSNVAVRHVGPVGLTAEGVPVETSEVQAARRAHLAAHALALNNGNDGGNAQVTAPVTTLNTALSNLVGTYGTYLPNTVGTLSGVLRATYAEAKPGITPFISGVHPTNFGVTLSDVGGTYVDTKPAISSTISDSPSTSIGGPSPFIERLYGSVSVPGIVKAYNSENQDISSEISAVPRLTLSDIGGLYGSVQFPSIIKASDSENKDISSVISSNPSSTFRITLPHIGGVYGNIIPGVTNAYNTAYISSVPIKTMKTTFPDVLRGYSVGIPPVYQNIDATLRGVLVASDGDGNSFTYTSLPGHPAPQVQRYGHKYQGPETKVVLTPAGVPVDTPEVQAARAADAIAHLEVKSRIFNA